MIRVLIRSLSDVRPGHAYTIGTVEIFRHQQLELGTFHALPLYEARLFRPSPADDELWRATSVADFDPRLLGPYDLLFQVLRNTVQHRTLAPAAARGEEREPSADAWWRTSALAAIPPF